MLSPLMKGRSIPPSQNKQKIFSLDQEEKRIKSEAQNITNIVKKEIDNLLSAKRVGKKLNNLLSKYTAKVQREQMDRLKFSNRSQINNELKAKLQREINGIRSSPNDFKHISTIDKSDLKKKSSAK